MQINLSFRQQQQLLEWVGVRTQAHVEADCEPPGYGIEISITSMACWAQARCGSERLDLGDVSVQLSSPYSTGAA